MKINAKAIGFLGGLFCASGIVGMCMSYYVPGIMLTIAGIGIMLLDRIEVRREDDKER